MLVSPPLSSTLTGTMAEIQALCKILSGFAGEWVGDNIFLAILILEVDWFLIMIFWDNLLGGGVGCCVYICRLFG